MSYLAVLFAYDPPPSKKKEDKKKRQNKKTEFARKFKICMPGYGVKEWKNHLRVLRLGAISKI